MGYLTMREDCTSNGLLLPTTKYTKLVSAPTPPTVRTGLVGGGGGGLALSYLISLG